MSPLWGITDMEGAGPDHRLAATPHVFFHSHSACAAGDVLRQDATVLRYAPRPIRTKRAQQSAPFSGRTLDVLAPLQLAVLALHLLQNAMVYINTLMMQRVLSEEAWIQRMTVDDLRALTPLIDSHISSYGTFLLDMNFQLDLDQPVEAVHTGTAQVTAKTIRKSARVPRSASAETQQLPLFNETP
jgi:Tn3 transposase DDE domain